MIYTIYVSCNCGEYGDNEFLLESPTPPVILDTRRLKITDKIMIDFSPEYLNKVIEGNQREWERKR